MAMYSDERGKEAVLVPTTIIYQRAQTVGAATKGLQLLTSQIYAAASSSEQTHIICISLTFPAHFKGTQSNLFAHWAQNNNGPPSSTLIYYYKSLVVPLAEYKQCTTSLLSS